MQTNNSRLWLAALLSLAPLAVALAAAPTANQTPKAGPVPRLADGHPDLSGVWWAGGDIGSTSLRLGPRNPDAPTYTSLYNPSAAAAAAKLSDKDDPTLKCAPVAFGTLSVRMWNVGAVGQIIATPKMVVLLSETFHDYQLVPTDGRAHRVDQPPTFRGDAVGHWEGDTFVVDVTNFTDDTWMFAEGRVSVHSDAMRIIERYRRVDANTLEIEAVVEDPKILTSPWKVPKQTLQLAPFDQLLSLNCSTEESDSMIQSAGQKQ
ncbi:MAG: hypothetical protein ABI616_14975 [Pseudomonadota bacterium]